MQQTKEYSQYKNRLYYSISEVSQITKIEQHVIRYWEKEFSQLKPKKNKQGVRRFQYTDLETLFTIKKLLYHNLYTIAGAKKCLAKSKKRRETTLDQFYLRYLKQELTQICNFLQDMRSK